MTTIEEVKLPNPVNVRFPKAMLEEVRKQALKSERTLSQQIRWLVVLGLESFNHNKNEPEVAGDYSEDDQSFNSLH
jgi:hypothetical protein